MKNKYLRIVLLLLLTLVSMEAFSQKQFNLISPNGKITTSIQVGNTIQYTVSHNGDLMLDESTISMSLTNGKTFGRNSRLTGSSTRTVNKMIPVEVYKRSAVEDHFNELTLKFRDGFNLIFRAYDEGVAYRFVSTLNAPFEVAGEEATFNFGSDRNAVVPFVYGNPKTWEDQFFNSFENIYSHIKLSEWESHRLAFLPLVVEGKGSKKICITDADLISYPGMYLAAGDGGNSLKAVFAPYPRHLAQGGYNSIQEKVTERENYIATYKKGKVEFPWRIVRITENDFELADTDLVFKLATPAAKGEDFSWVKPGKVAWEWWNNWNLYGVDFSTGVNNETYKYYIDFASEYGIEYVILDDGWSAPGKADLFDIVPEINIRELVEYGEKRNVGIILWAGYYAFNKDIEGICKYYADMGVKGFKVDFMDRDDQLMVDFHYETARITAKYKMLIDFHGTYKPTGLHRTYPNVVNNEGVYGLEQLKFEQKVVDLVTYDVTFPFVRMVAGQMDYTQGAMRNATKENFRAVFGEAMSMGTRCRQLAMYVIFESPLNMLCDSPSNYMKEEECSRFIAAVPTVWDETVSINGEIGKYITMARKKGNDWYVGSMTDWDARTIEIDLSFLDKGNYKAELFRDGANAEKVAADYKKEIIEIPQNRKLNLHMAPGGGFAMRIYQDPM